MTTLADQIKTELLRSKPGSAASRAAELATILRFAGGLHLISGKLAIEIELDSMQLAQRVARAVNELFGIQADLTPAPNSTARRTGAIQLRVVKEGELLARQAGLLDTKGRPTLGLPAHLVSSGSTEAKSIWRGAFLVQGSISDPQKNGSFEIVAPSNEAAMALVGVGRRIGVDAKVREVRGAFRVVVRDLESIDNLLTALGCSHLLAEWQSQQAQKEQRSTGQRLANFDDANLRRSAIAAESAAARVERALEILGNNIPKHLRSAGELRLRHRGASLDELGRLSEPALTKDAIAGRIRRLLSAADRQALEEGIPDTEGKVAKP